MTTPAKGSEEERRRWKRWARDNGLTDANGRFINTRISERRSRFRNGLEAVDIHLLRLIEKSMIDLVHFRNAVTERWPETIRTVLNRADGNDQVSGPFESWVGPQGLQKRIQSTRVWTDLIQFFVLEYHINNITWSADATSLSMRGSSGYFSEMGFTISEDDKLGGDIMDIVEGSMFGIGHLKNSVHELCMNIIMQENPTPQNNPLLFWVALCLQTEEFGNQRRLEIDGLKDELTMKEKLEALVHYARVFIMDHAYQSWLLSDSVPQEGKTALETALSSDRWDWINHGLPRPADQQGDPADFAQPHWQAFKTHFEALHSKWLVKGSNSPISIILELL